MKLVKGSDECPRNTDTLNGIGKMRRILSTKEVSMNRFCYPVTCDVTWHGHVNYGACEAALLCVKPEHQAQCKRVSDYCFCFNSFTWALGDDAVCYKFIPEYAVMLFGGVNQGHVSILHIMYCSNWFVWRWRDETRRDTSSWYRMLLHICFEHESKLGVNLMVGRMNTVSSPLPHVRKNAKRKLKKIICATQSTKRCH